jgi:release factor glutamine methyltransferase
VRLDAALADVSARLALLSDTPSLEAQVLLAHTLQKPRAWVLAHPEIELSLAQKQELEHISARRQKGEPLPYILGHWEFFGLDLIVTPAVLIPRPETEMLVERALEWLRSHPACLWAADVGTGSGCIAIALAAHIPDLQVLAADLSPQALDIARQNAARHGVAERITFIQADLLDLMGEFQPFDLITANLPYIPRQTLSELPISQYEPALALDGGPDGLDLISRLLTQTPAYLSPHGCLLMEIEARQGASVSSLTQAAFPHTQVQLLPDLAGYDRVIKMDLSASTQPLLVHLCTRSAWLAAQNAGIYQAESLASEGFIHISRPDQILKVANAFYRGLPDAILLWIDPARLQAELRWEAVDADVFPHLYGALNLDAVVSISDLIPDPDGVFRTLTR